VLITAGQALAQTTLEDYRAMVDDEQRTAAYAAAIQRRAKGATVADVGTGPFALLAVLAVKFGARKVYAIERTPEATMFEVC
jgi:predicted RNA methylase